MKRPTITLLLILSLAFALPTDGLTQFQQKPAQKPDLSTNTTAVILDVVVKDKRGRMVKDLSLSDFEVYEDGVRQQVDFFDRVTREPAGNAGNNDTAVKETAPKPAPAPAPASPRPPIESQPGVSAIALVFDRLSTDGRKRARDAAMSYVGESARPDFIGIFHIDLSLKVLQNYTTDNNLIRQGVEKAGAAVASTFGSNTESVRGLDLRREQSQAAVAANVAAAGGAGAAGNSAGAGAAGSAAGSASVDQAFTEMTQRSLETFEVMERDQQGYATSNGLLAVVNSMRALPGRKAVVFFSEGLSIPPNVLAHFRSVINQANRANVSIYAVDAAGLRAISANQESRDEINAMARRRMEQAHSGRPDIGGPMTAKLERNEDLLRLNPQSGLTTLAEETGGVFLGDTNNVGAKLQQLDEDLHSYYLLSYSPSNQTIDGKYRQIAVKLKRNDLDVQSRKGYYAVNATGYVPALYYEAPALAALNRTPVPTAFPIQSSAFNFPDASRTLRTAVEIETPTKSFTFIEDPSKKTFNTDFTILALIKDQSKQVVGKLSRQYLLNGPLDKMSATRSGAVLFYKETELPPGRYDIETVAYDAPSEKSSVGRAVIEVPAVDETKLRLSSISIIQRVEPWPAGQKTDSPFQVAEVMLYPSLTAAVRKSATKQMAFYFVVYPVKGSKTVPQLTLQVVQGNKMVADVQLKLSAPDANGRIPYASALPIESLSPGNYDLRITVKDGQTSVTRSQPFIIEP